MTDRGPVLTLFRSRLRPEHAGAYEEAAAHILALARRQPGFVDFRSYEAPDGERLSVIVFESRAAHDAWRDHPEHRAAQAQGRRRFYAEYSVTVCATESEWDFRPD